MKALKSSVIIALAVLFITPAFTQAAFNGIRYQGRLIDPTTLLPYPPGDYYIAFCITDLAPAILWWEAHMITITPANPDAEYEVFLGSDYSINISFEPYYAVWVLDVTNDPMVILTMQDIIHSVGYTHQAKFAEQADQADTVYDSSDGTYKEVQNITVDEANNADTLDGKDSTDFVAQGQTNSITSSMIQDGAVGNSDIANNAVTSSKILDSTITAADLAANSVGASEIAASAVCESEIRWSLNHQGTDLNGGLISLTNTSNGTAGNYPAGISGAANGDPGDYRVIGVMGLTPGLGSPGCSVGMLPNDRIGVVGAANDGYGVVGVSTDHYSAAVYGESTKGYGVYGKHTDPLYTSPGVYGKNTGSGCGVLADGGSGAGLIARSTSGNPLEAYDQSPYNRRFYVSNAGQVYADGSFNSGGADVAEMLPAKPGLEPGDVLVIDPEGKLIRSSEPSAPNVVGVYSTSPGFIGGNSDDDDPTGKVPLAILGIVPCKVSAENGPIKPGDLLVTSSTPGYAMKAPDNPKAGTILGKALSSLESDMGLIKLYVAVN